MTDPRDSLPAATERASGTLLRGLDVLSSFRPERAEMSNSDLSRVTGLPKPTISRLTHALVEAGYLEQAPGSGGYRLRPRVLTLGFSLLSTIQFLPVLHNRMQRLADASSCVVSLAAGDGSRMIYLDRCGGDAMPYFFSVGSAVETARTAIGRAYLAGLPLESRNAWFEKMAAENGIGWPMLETAINKSMAEVADRGFCLVDRTWRRSIRSIAAPIVSADGSTVYAVGCVTPVEAMTAQQLCRRWGPRLQQISMGILQSA